MNWNPNIIIEEPINLCGYIHTSIDCLLAILYRNCNDTLTKCNVVNYKFFAGFK